MSYFKTNHFQIDQLNFGMYAIIKTNREALELFWFHTIIDLSWSI